MTEQVNKLMYERTFLLTLDILNVEPSANKVQKISTLHGINGFKLLLLFGVERLQVAFKAGRATIIQLSTTSITMTVVIIKVRTISEWIKMLLPAGFQVEPAPSWTGSPASCFVH